MSADPGNPVMPWADPQVNPVDQMIVMLFLWERHKGYRTDIPPLRGGWRTAAQIAEILDDPEEFGGPREVESKCEHLVRRGFLRRRPGDPPSYHLTARARNRSPNAS